MKKLAQFSSAIAAAILLSSATFAGTGSVILHTDAYSNSEAAYDAGFDIIDNLSQASQGELKQALKTYNEGVIHNLTIDNTKVKVEEVAVSRDAIQYRASVEVDYEFDGGYDD